MSAESDRLHEIVSSVYSRIIGDIGNLGKGPQSNDERFVYEIESFQQEIGSGASFDQYFLWSGREEIERIVKNLEILGLEEVTEVTQKAIEYAFPLGVSKDPAVFEDQTDFSEEQSAYLGDLYRKVEHFHVDISTLLGKFCEKHNILE